MNFRTTAFDPMDGQQLRQNDPTVDFASMEKNLAREMARMKITDEKKRREIEKVCAESDELKRIASQDQSGVFEQRKICSNRWGLIQKIKRACKLHYFYHFLIISFCCEQEADAHVEMEMLRRKEQADQAQRAAAAEKQGRLFSMKHDVQS